MEPVTSAIEWAKGVVKSAEGCIRSAISMNTKDPRCENPIEILKRLQQEAFSDLMKLRARQEKVEQVLSLHKTSNRSIFHEEKSHVKGVIDVVGAWFLANVDSEQSLDILDSAGIRTGVGSRFIFEKAVRQKDVLTAEFVANNRSFDHDGDLSQTPLSLAKVAYMASVNDWFSVSAIPMGAQCRDFRECEPGDISCYGPPLFNQYHSCAAAVKVMGSKLTTSVAGLVSSSHQPSIPNCLATFGQFTFQLYEGTKITLSGLWQIPRPPFRQMKLGPLAVPVFGRNPRHPDAFKREVAFTRPVDITGGSVALMLDSQLDDTIRVGGWLQKTHLDHVEWSVSLADLPPDELGWGLSISGSGKSPRSLVHFDAFLNLKFGNRLNLQPGLVYAVDGASHKPFFTISTNWTL